jgi:putative transposase
MGRQPRSYTPNGIYHLTAHGIDDRPVFVDDVDRQSFVMRLLRAIRMYRWSIWAACLMDTHYHLVLQPLKGEVSDGMRLLNGGHSRAFNARHNRRGALFESRFTDRTIRDEEHLAAAIQYVEYNAVSAGMVEAVTDWPWSTHAGCDLHRVLRPYLKGV